jgi:hypothetical protein
MAAVGKAGIRFMMRAVFPFWRSTARQGKADFPYIYSTATLFTDIWAKTADDDTQSVLYAHSLAKHVIHIVWERIYFRLIGCWR